MSEYEDAVNNRTSVQYRINVHFSNGIPEFIQYFITANK